MIRYAISMRRLDDLVRHFDPAFLDDAARDTDHYRDLGRFDGKRTDWGDAKRAFMRLQHYKCGFCERKLEGPEYGSREHDLEHFRPKSVVRDWAASSVFQAAGLEFDFDLGGDEPKGYHLLAYNVWNYLASCKTCNSSLKSAYFPTARARDTEGDDPRALGRSEKPFLIYPIGAADERPENLITFDGIVPVPVGSRGHKRRRAEVTIDFFALDRREELLRERAEILVQLFVARQAADNPDEQVRRAAIDLIDIRSRTSAAHANCARAFVAAMSSSPAHARELVGAAIDYLESLDGAALIPSEPAGG